MSEFVEGRNPVLEALRAGTGIAEILIARGLSPSAVVDRIREEAAAAGVPVREVERTEVDALSAHGSHQGVAARVEAFAYAALESVVRPQGASLLVVLDHVTDPGNLGAIIRSAEAFGADGVVIPKARAASVTSVTMKAAAGAASHLPVAKVSNIAQALASLKRANYWTAGASQRANNTMRETVLDDRLAIVLGSEDKGLSRLVEQSCDFLIRIPLPGRTESLNVAQAATILAYEWTRRHGT